VHLPALPGAPRAEATIDAIEAQALAEARLLHGAGYDGCVVENYGDTPFYKDSVDAVTVASMTRIVAAVCRALPGWRVGVNVLRNDARAAVAIATASGARFVRVNVHVGATATDQGVIEGRAAETLRLRKALGSNVEIWADVHVKHGRSLAHAEIEREAEDAVQRGHADALIVSGAGTGKATDLDELQRVRDQKLGVPVLAGSGVTLDNAADILQIADGVIVGTSLKKNARTDAALDPERTRRFVETARALRSPY